MPDDNLIEPDERIEIVEEREPIVPDLKAHHMRREATLVELTGACPFCDCDLETEQCESMGRDVTRYSCPRQCDSWILNRKMMTDD